MEDDDEPTGESELDFGVPELRVRVLQNWSSGALIGGVVAPGACRVCQVLTNRFGGCNPEAPEAGFWRNKSVVELGAGTGLVSVLLAKLGAKPVFATDLEDVLENLTDNLSANEYPEESCAPVTQELSWGDWEHTAALLQRLGGPPDWILAAECLYTTPTVRPFLETLLRLTGPQTSVLFCGVPCHRRFDPTRKPIPGVVAPRGLGEMGKMEEDWSAVMIEFLNAADALGFTLYEVSRMYDHASPGGLAPEMVHQNQLPSHFNRAVLLLQRPAVDTAAMGAADKVEESKEEQRSAEEDSDSFAQLWPVASDDIAKKRLPRGGAQAVWNFVVATAAARSAEMGPSQQ